MPACQTTNRTVRHGVAAASRARARGLRANHGYAMAALLVAIGIMGILMTVAMPVWHQTMQREKEEELIFRGRQYARAIGLFQRKFAGAYPPSVDLLVQQKFLRKKYKDPMVEDGQFLLIPAGAMQAGQMGVTMPPGGSTSRGSTSQGTFGRTGSGTAFGSGTGATQGSQLTTGLSGQTVVPGGIVGVVSKSKDKSIKLYNGRDHYNAWLFVYSAARGRGVGPGVGGPGRGPGGRGGPQGPGQNPFGPGRNPFGPGQNPPGASDRFGPGGGRGRGPGG